MYISHGIATNNELQFMKYLREITNFLEENPMDKLALNVVETYTYHSFKEIKEMVHLKSINNLFSKALVYAIKIGDIQIGQDLADLSKRKQIHLSITHTEIQSLVLEEAFVLIEKLVCANAKLLTDVNSLDVDELLQA